MTKLIFIFNFFVIGLFAYQDSIVRNQVVKEGTQRCQERYDLIRPILNKYNRRFSVLDIGANFGYFSFRIAEEYNAICTMIEGNDKKKKLYSDAQDHLLSLCQSNSHLDNIYFLQHRLNLSSTYKLNKLEHFDVVLAFLVIHMMAADERGVVNFDHVKQYVDLILSLGNDVIIEMSVDVYPDLDEYVHQVCLDRGAIFLGEMRRSKPLENRTLGRFYWFQNNKNRSNVEARPISSKTFKQFNGVFPVESDLKTAG